eukprot:c23064_g1_i1 orf=193-1980(-)
MATSGAVIMRTRSGKTQRMVFARRWSGFVVAIWLMAFSGSYGFPNYSTALKNVLGLNQKQLNRLSVAKDLGDSCGILAGILCNYLPAQALLSIGACIGFVGFGIQWLVVSGLISAPPYWTMFIVAMLSGNAISWMNTSVFTLSVRNFPRNRGPVVGLFKAYMGLSAAIFSNFCDNFFNSSSSVYLLMLTVIPPTFCVITAIFFRPVPPSETPEDLKIEQQSLFAFNMMSIVLALVLLVHNLVPGVNQGVARPVLMVLLFAVLAAPALVPLVLFSKRKREPSIGGSSNGGYTDEGVEDTAEAVDASTVGVEEDGLRKPLLDQAEVESPPALDDWGESSAQNGALAPVKLRTSDLKLGDDWPTLSLFKTWHPYVLYITLFCGTGSGMAFINNLGQVGQSFGYSTVTLFTSLFSLGNFFGRIISGNVSEYFLTAMSTPRPAWIGAAKVPMIALFAWLSVGSGASLYAGAPILGFAHGSLITLTIPTISEFYGLKYFGTNYMVINTHILAGSTIFSGWLAGYLYDQHATYTGSDGSLTCYGASCYGTTFRLYAGCLAVALFLFDGLLSFYSRPLYRQLKDINTAVRSEKISHTNSFYSE